ncbi:MAG TPA: hypothetical protein VJ436_09730 [Anaerolineales bacterium]|nr:hypothetical protein [Anaerolineales bacterium]
MKHMKFWKPSLVSLAALVMLTLLAGVAFAQSGYTSDGGPHVNSVIDFEGLAEGAIVSSLSSGNGISGESVTGQVAVFGLNPVFGSGTNAAMIFDSTCPTGNTPADCSGRDADLFKPELGKILIVSEDLDSSDPDDSDAAKQFFELDFSGFGLGKVTVDSLDVIDIEEAQNPGTAKVDLYSGGPGGTLLGSVKIGDTGNNGVKTVQIGVSGVDFMRVRLNGSGGIDNLRLRPEIEVLYLSNTDQVRDGISHLYRVEIDDASGVANLIPLPNGKLNYDTVDVIAVTPKGDRLYFVDDGFQPVPSYKSTLGYYDFASSTVVEVGVIKWGNVTYLVVDQAAFSPSGELYITGSVKEKLFTVNTNTSVATEVGTIVNQATGVKVNLVGADIAFTSDNTLYVWVNREKPGAPFGLYSLALPAVNGKVLATHIGPSPDAHIYRGMAVRFNGTGDLVGSTGEDELHVLSRVDSHDVIPPLKLFINGQPFDHTAGDMAIGPFAP